MRSSFKANRLRQTYAVNDCSIWRKQLNYKGQLWPGHSLEQRAIETMELKWKVFMYPPYKPDLESDYFRFLSFDRSLSNNKNKPLWIGIGGSVEEVLIDCILFLLLHLLSFIVDGICFGVILWWIPQVYGQVL